MARYWFKPKKYGYGATPVTWEGWVATLAAAVVVAGSIVAMIQLVDKSDLMGWLLWVGLIAAITYWFVQFCRWRTDGEWRWRWGDGSDARKT